jgi:hypothetical protein
MSLLQCSDDDADAALPAVVAAVQSDPLSLLVDDALVASWVRQGLPSDPTSVQNGTILTNSERWPLLMDPQLQGVLWIKEREGKNNLQVRAAAACSLCMQPLHAKPGCALQLVPDAARTY